MARVIFSALSWTALLPSSHQGMLPTSSESPIVAEWLQIENSLAEDAFMQLLPFQPVLTGPRSSAQLLCESRGSFAEQPQPGKHGS